MWRISRPIVILLILHLVSSSYLEFPLVRSPNKSQHYKNEPVVCKNETTLNQDAEYH